MNSPIKWLGGKARLANKIIEIIPPHEIYVEPFGGAGWVLFKKPPSKTEVYNDINPNLVNFFKVVKDKNKYKKLIEKLELTPFSRKLFKESVLFYEQNADFDDVEKAVLFYVLVKQSYSGNLKSWSFATTNKKIRPKEYYNNLFEKIRQAHYRISNVIIENSDFRDIIKKYDSEKTLFYLDPPYVHDVRSQNDYYDFEMTNEEHEELVDILLNIKGKAILSGYENHIYTKLEKSGWNKKVWKVPCLIGVLNRNFKNQKQTNFTRIEAVWYNYEIEKEII